MSQPPCSALRGPLPGEITEEQMAAIVKRMVEAADAAALEVISEEQKAVQQTEESAPTKDED